MKRIAFTLLFIFLIAFVSGQPNTASRKSTISAGYLQAKESANFGLVFRGPDIIYGMQWDFRNEKRIIQLGYELGVGIPITKKIPSLAFYMKPVDFGWLRSVPIGENRLFIGPGFKVEYSYSLYPQLQSGFDYWFTNISVNLNSQYEFKAGKSEISIRLKTSLLGFTSRQPDYRDPYYFDVGFKHAIRHLNKDLMFGSFNSFNTSSLEIFWRAGENSRVTLGYEMRYAGYYKSPGITTLAHSILLVINKKQNIK